MGIQPRRDGKRSKHQFSDGREIYLKNGDIHIIPQLSSASFRMECSSVVRAYQNVFRYSVDIGSRRVFHEFSSTLQDTFVPKFDRGRVQQSVLQIIAYHYVRKVLQQSVSHPAHKDKRVSKVISYWKEFDVWEQSLNDYEEFASVALVMNE